MASKQSRREAQAAALKARQQAEARQNRLRVAGAAIVVAVVVIVALVVISVTNGSSKSSVATSAAPAADVTAATTVQPSALAQVGAGGTSSTVYALDGKAETKDGKPLVLYVGAEYCPYCAAERWAVVNALSRFGTWSNLSETASSASDVYPSTPTFSFHGATFTSTYLSFDGVETRTNKTDSSGDYATLDTLTTEQAALVKTYDSAPYVPSNAAGSIPFIYLGGVYGLSGSGYDPALLKGMTFDQIASGLPAADSAASKAILGAANRLTAALCDLTKGNPTKVCGAEPVTTLVKDLPAIKTAG